MENKYHSYNIKDLPEGCKYCVKGEKVVVFITGVCPRSCDFCPVSDEKYQKDVTFANERSVKEIEDLIKEAKAMKARGAGITGGDPLSRLDRTCEFIQKLKEEFGQKFHIHLYTSLNLANEKTLKRLHEAGLDEIRFHLDLESEKLWDKLSLARKFDWDVGVEIPLLPEADIKRLIDYVHDKVDFLNLNELEVADNSHSDLIEKGMKVKDSTSYAVEGSLNKGLEALEYAKRYDFAAHLCTAKLKDAVQLANRIKRESEGVKKAFDLVDEEGMLTRGALYLEDLKPGFEYRKLLSEVDKNKYVESLKPFLERIKKKFKLDDEEYFLDTEKPRILLSKKLVKKKKEYFKNLGLCPAVVVEYPTADQLEMEVDLL
ncbi:radical SAM protein [Candidatus Woesearchaeota archaeon CG10_big_fil_rev_8_21_14_0_10_45_16]|nr:MAG: radical SAM protein [Candidatus Woesearchaeota archaeon CG10_big_fil_rev_8_21_14_0_10_45_16]